MEIIKVQVAWAGGNFSGGWGYPGVGAIIAVGDTLEEFKADLESALAFHIEGAQIDGDELPEWLVKGDYRIDYDYKASHQ